MPSWTRPPLTVEESERLSKLMECDVTTPVAAALLETNESQADAFRRYVILVCVLNKRRRRGIPCEAVERKARIILRALSPAMRNKLPEALRWGV